MFVHLVRFMLQRKKLIYSLLLKPYNIDIEQNCPDLFPASMKMGSMVKVIPGRSSSARLLGTCMTFGSMCISLPIK